MKILTLIIDVAAVLGLAAALCLRAAPWPSPLPGPTPESQQPKITWSKDAVVITLLPGDIRVRNLLFTSTAPLQNASVEAVPEISRFLTVVPSSIGNLPSQQSQPIQVRVAIPLGTPWAAYEGTIHVKDGSSTAPQPLKVFINIGLPPDPGNAGQLTLAGIDSDGDGVRDDVQRYISVTYSQSAKQRAVLSQIALAIEAELLGTDNARQQVSNGLDCLNYTLTTGDADMTGGKLAHDRYISLRALLLNTPDRAKAFFQADNLAGPAVRFSTPYLQKAARCTTDPSVLPN